MLTTLDTQTKSFPDLHIVSQPQNAWVTVVGAQKGDRVRLVGTSCALPSSFFFCVYSKSLSVSRVELLSQ